MASTARRIVTRAPDPFPLLRVLAVALVLAAPVGVIDVGAGSQKMVDHVAAPEIALKRVNLLVRDNKVFDVWVG